MQRLVACAALAFLALLVTGCHSGEVRLRISPESSGHEWRKPISAEQFSAPVRKLFYAVEPPLGYAEARLHPLEGHVLSAQMRWNAVIRSLLDRFDELRVQHNEARITVSGFDQRRGVLLVIAKDLAAKKALLDAAIEQYSAAKGELAAGPPRQGEQTPQTAREARVRMDEAQATADRIIKEAAGLVGALGPS